MIGSLRREFMTAVLVVLLSLASCVPADINQPTNAINAQQAKREAQRQKDESLLRKNEEYRNLCQQIQAAPLKERNAKGSIWVMSANARHPKIPAVYMGNLEYQTKHLWPEAKSNSAFEAQSLLCILVEEKEINAPCHYQPFGGSIDRINVITSLSFADLASREKIGETKFVSMPDCPPARSLTGGRDKVHGTEATKEEIISWAKQHWSL